MYTMFKYFNILDDRGCFIMALVCCRFSTLPSHGFINFLCYITVCLRFLSFVFAYYNLQRSFLFTVGSNAFSFLIIKIKTFEFPKQNKNKSWKKTLMNRWFLFYCVLFYCSLSCHCVADINPLFFIFTLFYCPHNWAVTHFRDWFQIYILILGSFTDMKSSGWNLDYSLTQQLEIITPANRLRLESSWMSQSLSEVTD